MAGVVKHLDAYARACQERGFTFDDLVVAAHGRGELGEVADWLVKAHRSGFLIDLGSETLADGTALTPRRYAVADQALAAKRIDLRLPAEPRTVRMLRWAATTFAERHGAARPHDVQLAISEAATNAVRHAYVDEQPGEVRLVACARPEALVMVVRDWGAGGMKPRLDSPGLGIGLPTIAQVTESLEVEPADGGGTLLRMRFAYRDS